MKETEINQIFKDTAYIRTGGSDQELRCARYLQDKCREFGGEAVIEPFEVQMAQMHTATLTIDGTEIPCKGYFCCGSGSITAPLYYLTDSTPYSLSQCKDKIVMIDGYLGYWKYQDIVENGALGFITYNGNVTFPDQDIDQRELRANLVSGGTKKILGVNIHVSDAIALVKRDAREATITLSQEESIGHSRNVVLDMPGEIPQYIVMSAHYDSVPLSVGAYDNMSGSIGILAVARYFANHPHRYGLRFVWCGSEERGLLGSKAYCAAHTEELKDIVLNINLDMIGCIMGRFESCCTAEEKLLHFIEYFSSMEGFGCTVTQGVYPSDSTPFADSGVPAVTFARSAPGTTATIHNRYDTVEVMKESQMVKDIDFIRAFTEQMANSVLCPVSRTIPDNMKDKLDEYMTRKRPKN